MDCPSKPYGFWCKTHRIVSLIIKFYTCNCLLFCTIQMLYYPNMILLLCWWVSMFASATWSRCSIDKFGYAKNKILSFVRISFLLLKIYDCFSRMIKKQFFWWKNGPEMPKIGYFGVLFLTFPIHPFNILSVDMV